ncbi:MAG: hypothetical protein M1832_003011 [Thelocarpon impressellum]|nr:MAG: hypothetical protein M1832_003011 [Thelocarpon impressellum]
MGGNGWTDSVFNDSQEIRRALEIARNSETADLDPAVRELLERAADELWGRLQAQPDTYILTRDEFAVFNYFFADRFQASELARAAIGRFWDHYGRDGPYNPPASCEFNRVTFNLTVVSAGRQFDRLGILYFGDTEIFRTSTAEPTASGIRWTYLKDMSSYLALFKLPQKIIFDLGNLIDDTYTAPFNATLTASFFSAAGQPTWADAILPISAQRSSSGRPSAFSIPQQKAASKITLPQNIRRAAVTISACGQADEEFWFGNVLTSDRSVFPLAGEPLLGYSPFREVQLLIDGELAGVAWPFPIIFTGGVVPGLWRPVVGIDTFDLREREIDITPWLPILCDGASSGHTFEIRVVGIDDDGSGNGSLSKVVGNSWIVTGKIFLWLGEAGSITTGTRPIVSVPEEPMISIVSSVLQNSTGDNETLSYNVTVHRQLSISSLLDTSAGHRVASWTQTLAYENNGHLTKQGNLQAIDQLTTGSDMSASGYASTYSFPVSLTTEFAIDRTSGVFTIDAEISRGYPSWIAQAQWYVAAHDSKWKRTLHVDFVERDLLVIGCD